MDGLHSSIMAPAGLFVVTHTVIDKPLRTLYFVGSKKLEGRHPVEAPEGVIVTEPDPPRRMI